MRDAAKNRLIAFHAITDNKGEVGQSRLNRPGGKLRMSKVVLAACAVLLLVAEARAQSDWKKEWEKIIEGAKKEGQVNVYIGGWETVLESGA